MLLATLACALAAATNQSLDAPRLRTLLPNGAAILVERVPRARVLSVHLMLGTNGVPPDRGERHLLEHLMARGITGDIDKRLEVEGAYLRPQTLRDGMSFEVIAPPDKLALALGAVSELLETREFTEAAIQREVEIIGQEEALRGPLSRLSEAAWRSAYGEAAEDPLGDLESIRKATPASLRELAQSMVAATNLAITVVGDVDLDVATAAVRPLIESLPKKDFKPPPARAPLEAPTLLRVDIPGACIAVPVGDYREARTAATLAAALAIASSEPRCFVTYTPASRGGLVILGADSNATLARAIKGTEAAPSFELGKAMGTRWVQRQLDTPSAVGFARGLLLVQSPDLKPETLSDNLRRLGFSTFESAIKAFSESGVRVVGT